MNDNQTTTSWPDYFTNITPTLAADLEYEQVPCSGGLFFFFVYGPLYGLVCGLGLIGNSLSFAILHKYSKDSVATYLLKALAIVDNVFLATSGFVQMFTAMSVYFGYSDQLESIYPYLQSLAWPIVHTVQMGTVWVMVLVAANRYVAVCRPLHAARICSKRNVRVQMLVTFVCVVVYNAPRFAEYHYVVVSDATGDGEVSPTKEVNVGLASMQLYNYIYENFAYCLFVYLIPLTTLIILNVHLVRELNRAQRSRQTFVGRASSEENNITLVMIIIIVSFIVCETPASINQVLFYLVSAKQLHTCSSYQKLFHVSNLLITTNSSLNFVIYCLFRRQFQQELRAMVCRKTGRGATMLRRTVLLRALHSSSSISAAHGGSVAGGLENGQRISVLYESTSMNGTLLHDR